MANDFRISKVNFCKINCWSDKLQLIFQFEILLIININVFMFRQWGYLLKNMYAAYLINY